MVLGWRANQVLNQLTDKQKASTWEASFILADFIPSWHEASSFYSPLPVLLV